MYYLGYEAYMKRFNTYYLYYKLLRDKKFKLIYLSKMNSIHNFDVSKLQMSDIILWQSGKKEGKNIQTSKIVDYIGKLSLKVSLKIGNKPYITHLVGLPSYNNFDIFNIRGSRTNTLEAYKFITLKQRGIFAIRDTEAKIR